MITPTSTGRPTIRRKEKLNAPAAEILLPVLVVLLAAALRLYALDRIPPGLFYDESANGIDALRVLAGWHPVFFPSDQGREPLFIYLQALAIALLGRSPLALRLPSAVLGVLTVAATYTTFRAMAGRTVGLLGAFLLAVSFWHLSLSRLGFRTSALPLFATLAVFWLWKAVREGRWWQFALFGACLGIDLYTYIPSRLAPPLVALWLAVALVVPAWRSISARRILAGGTLALAILILAALPLGAYFAHHPKEFYRRIENAARPGNPVAVGLDGGVRAVEGLFWSGDPNPRQDLPGRPLIDVPVALAGVAGLVDAARRWRAPAAFCLIWSLAMLGPAAFGDEPAHALRLAGVLPFVLFFPAAGLAWLGRRRWREARIGALVALAILIGGAVATARDYFVVWPTRPDVEHAFQSDLLQALPLVNQAPPAATVLATIDDYEGEPVPLRFVPAAEVRARGFDGQSTFVLPSGVSGSIYYVYGAEFEPGAGIPAPLRLVADSRDAAGRIVGRLYRLDPPFVAPAATRPAAARFGSTVQVTGLDLPSRVRPGDILQLGLHWTVLGVPPPGRWQVFAHLVDRNQQRLLVQGYNHGFPPEEWRPGDQVVSWFDLPIPADAPAAAADVDFGLVDADTGRRLEVSTPDGRDAGTFLPAGPVRIARPGDVPPPAVATTIHFGSAIDLVGYDLGQSADGQITLRLHWLARGPSDQDYTVFVHALDASGKVIAGADSQPGAGAYPTSTWASGETFLDPHQLTLPPGAKLSRLEVGLYLLSTGQRLPASGASGKPLGDAVEIPAGGT